MLHKKQEEFLLGGKTAIITGASRGLGFASAQYLGEMGANVVIADIAEHAAKEASRILQNSGIIAESVYVDVSNPESIYQMVEKAHDIFGKIDILVNNAGIFDSRPIPEIPIEDWKRVIDINLSGVHYCSQIILKEMIERKTGKIVNITSMAAQTGGIKGGVNYASSKAGVIGLTKSYARFAAPYGITVNAIAPGLIKSEMTKNWAEPSQVPMNRLGDPIDVARVVFFLVSPLSTYITGQVISVNGGMVMP